MVCCSVCGFSKSVDHKGLPVSYHSFPKNILQKESWVQFVNRANWELSKSSRICSQHFNKDSFFKCGTKTALKPTAIPSIHVERLKYIRNFIPVMQDSKSDISLQKSSKVLNDSTTEVTEILNINSENVLMELKNQQEMDKLTTSLQSTCSNNTDSILNSSIYDTPRKINLRRQLLAERRIRKLQLKRIKILMQQNRRQKKRLKDLKTLLKSMRSRKMINNEMEQVLQENFSTQDFFKKLFSKKVKGKRIRKKKYQEDIRRFAITLHYFSPRAYNYVRSYFKYCLPHPKTLSRWYKTIDAKPGFTTEVLDLLKLKSKKSDKKIFCSLVFDEISLRERIEWVADKLYGVIDIGNNMKHENIGTAKQALVFMIVAINETWKVPVGYFFINSIDSQTKANLVEHCFCLLQKCNIIITNLTFDGAATNFATVRALECDTRIENIINKTKKFGSEPDTHNSLYIIPDPPHMIKLVRNVFEKIIIIDSNNKRIDFNYIKKLNELQQTEGMHLANNLRPRHVNFLKQKMKVKLATQLMSRSVAQALIYCKNELQMQDFSEAEATIKFITMFNDVFDILNSHKLSGFGYKQALCEQNIQNVEKFYENIYSYIKNLKLEDNTFLIKSDKKTEFLGILIALKSVIDILYLKNMYKI